MAFNASFVTLVQPIYLNVLKIKFVITFLRASAMLKHVIAIGWTFVRPSDRLSLCPSHAGIVSKRLNLSSNSLHGLVDP